MPKTPEKLEAIAHFDVRPHFPKSYLLGYPLFLVYPKDNSILPAGRKFLTTRQGHYLLSKAELIRLQPAPEKYLRSHDDCKSVL